MAQTKSSDDASKSTKSSIKEILYDGNLYDVTTFLSRHPGGREIILNFTEAGENATMAIQQFHSRSIDNVLKMMKTLPNRPQPQIELSKEMAQAKKRNEAMTTDFVNLYKEFLEEKLFEPSFLHLMFRFMEWIALGLVGFSLLTESSSLFWRIAGSFIYAFSLGRGTWIMHEFGHISATGNPKLDRILQNIIAGISIGSSGLWWRQYHNMHHAMTNRVVIDPGLHPLPGLFSFNVDALKDPVKDQTFFIRNQKYFFPFYAVLYYFRVLTLGTMVILYKERNIVELISVTIHYVITYQIGLQMYIVTVTIGSFYVTFHLLISHSFAPVTYEPEHWVEQSFVHTVNVTPGRFNDWWTGYINYQIEHHLFPTMPNVKIPLIVDRVKTLAEKHGLPYHVYSYVDTAIKTFGNIKHVSEVLKHLG